MNETAETLRMLVDGIVTNLYHTEQALSIFDMISHNSNGINAATYGQFFGSLQHILGPQLILGLAKIYEPNPRKYQLKSIPSVIDFLRTNELYVEDNGMINLEKEYKKCGIVIPEDFKSDNVTELLLAHFNSTIPIDKKDPRIIKLYEQRDKIIAHSEHLDEKAEKDLLGAPVMAEIDDLILTAKKFIKLIGFTYLNTAYSLGSTDYLLSSDAKRSTVCLKRILNALNIEATYPNE